MTFISSFIPLILAFYLLLYSTFISIEIPLIMFQSLDLKISFLLDWTSMLFLSTVMFISSMILLFSMYYIPNKEHKQFHLILLSFILSMALLITSDNIFFMLLGWDGLGLTSYILVIYYQNFSSAASGSITIFSNRFGDIMILLSISFLLMIMNWNFSMNDKFPYLILILLILAGCSKSAQFPFSAWLPAAMAAPTPISALVHSSTLVTAGIFLFIRIFDFSHPNSMMIMMVISSMTTIYASMAANWEMDMKKIIALSTLSQIAMMMFAISINSINLAFFHLIIHALFKSMMFLCAGIMIHSSSYQDMRSMGTVMFNYPLINSILGISSMALMGLPFMSGFFSKDSIIEMLMWSNKSIIMIILMTLSIGMTATYSIRMMKFSMKFYLKSKPDVNIYPNNYMEIPIMIMAPLSIFVGSMMSWIYIPEQIIIIPFNFKLSIILTLITGALMGYLLEFMSSNYKKLGFSSLSLWFIHFITSYSLIPISPMMNSLMKNDKKWMEFYGPNFMFIMFSHSSQTMDKLLITLMFLIMLMVMTPLLAFLF